MTKIQWTDATWNPVRGCAVVSPGCTNCYAMAMAHRFSGPGRPYEGLTKLSKGGPVWTGSIRLVPEVLDAPLRWRKPRRIFVNSMSDLFHEDIPDSFRARVFAVMAYAQRHTFQVLTKRPKNMIRFMDWISSAPFLNAGFSGADYWRMGDYRKIEWPLPNVWLGVSVEDQARADERIPLLLETPAAVRFLSIEPLLGPVDLDAVNLGCAWRPLSCACSPPGPCELHPTVDWVIVGGESGPGARRCDHDWIRKIVDDCRDSVVPCFVNPTGSSARRARTSRRTYPSGWPEDLRVREFP